MVVSQRRTPRRVRPQIRDSSRHRRRSRLNSTPQANTAAAFRQARHSQSSRAAFPAAAASADRLTGSRQARPADGRDLRDRADPHPRNPPPRRSSLPRPRDVRVCHYRGIADRLTGSRQARPADGRDPDTKPSRARGTFPLTGRARRADGRDPKTSRAAPAEPARSLVELVETPRRARVPLPRHRRPSHRVSTSSTSGWARPRYKAEPRPRNRPPRWSSLSSGWARPKDKPRRARGTRPIAGRACRDPATCACVTTAASAGRLPTDS